MTATRTLKTAKLSDELERWLTGDRKKTLGSFMDASAIRALRSSSSCSSRSRAAAADRWRASCVEIIATLIALELIVGRHEGVRGAARDRGLRRRVLRSVVHRPGHAPALGVVLLTLGVLLEDSLVVAIAGAAPEIVLEAAAIHGLRAIF